MDIVCNYPLPSDLFAQSIHPSEPVISVGLATGHVRTFRLPSTHLEPAPPVTGNGSSTHAGSRRLSSSSVNGCATIETQWQTRRHKGSCRALIFSADGTKLFSTGMDGLVKIASAETGAVQTKLIVNAGQNDPKELFNGHPTVMATLTPDTLLVGTESANIYVYDLRSPGAQRAQSYEAVHGDYISSLTPLAPSGTSTSGLARRWVSTGAAELAVTDLRRGVLATSDDQDEELLCSVASQAHDEKVFVGSANGGLLVFERGEWRDRVARASLDPGESIEALCRVPEAVFRGGGVAAGLGDGRVMLAKMGKGGHADVLREVRHDEFEGVVGVGFEAEGRMVSGGGGVVKVWQEKLDENGEVEGMESSEDDEESDDDNWELAVPTNGLLGQKRDRPSDEGSASDEKSTDEEGGKRKRKKRKRRKGKERRGGQHSVKIHGLE